MGDSRVACYTASFLFAAAIDFRIKTLYERYKRNNVLENKLRWNIISHSNDSPSFDCSLL